jgi:O-antigen ligase
MHHLTQRRNAAGYIIVAAAASSIGAGIALLCYAWGAAAAVIAVLAVLFGVLALPQLPRVAAQFKALARRLRWWHLLWLLMFASGMVFRVRDTESLYSNPLDFWALFRIALMALVAVVLLGQLAVRGSNWLKTLFRGTVGLLTVFSLIGVLSTAWSVYPVWTLYRSLEYLVDMWLAAATLAAVRAEGEVQSLFDWAWVMLMALTLSVWLGMAFWPKQAIATGMGALGLQIQGVIPSVASNAVGELGAILAIVALSRLLFPTQLKRTYLLLFLAGLATLLLSQSRSPLTGFLLALPLVLFTARRIRVLLLLALLLPAVVLFTDLGDVFWQFFMRGQSQELFSSLSGRVYWWRSGLQLLAERPLWGYGAYAGARFVVLSALEVTLSSTIHNTWFEAALGTGLIGLLPLLAGFIWMWVLLLGFGQARMRDHSRMRLRSEAVGVFSILSVRSVFTSTLIWHPPLLFMLVLVYGEYLRENRDAT